jgi:hypothetical protein
MKKVLLISFYFPPLQNIGARRPFGLAKYLPRFGWEPIVLTIKLPGKPPEGMNIITTDYKDVVNNFKSMLGFNPQKSLHEQLGITISKNYNFPTLKSKIIKFAKEIITFPDDKKGWYDYAIRTATNFLSKEKVDAIISTSPPVISHLIARKIKQKYNIPWIADFRDLWTQNHYYNKFGIIKFFEKRLEVNTLSDADFIVTAHPLENLLGILHKDKKILCITNGYDSDDYDDISGKLSDKFTITYTGILYNGKRDPSMLFRVIKNMIDQKKIDRRLVEISFFGPKENWLLEEVEKYNLNGIVKVNGIISREETLKLQRESQILLILLWDNKDEKNIYPGKIFEYLGARRPIIAIGGNGGVVKDLLEETNAGKFAENINILKDAILKYYQEYIQFKEVKYNGNSKIVKYTYDSLAKKYSEILNEITNEYHCY